MVAVSVVVIGAVVSAAVVNVNKIRNACWKSSFQPKNTNGIILKMSALNDYIDNVGIYVCLTV